MYSQKEATKKATAYFSENMLSLQLRRVTSQKHACTHAYQNAGGVQNITKNVIDNTVIYRVLRFHCSSSVTAMKCHGSITRRRVEKPSGGEGGGNLDGASWLEEVKQKEEEEGTKGACVARVPVSVSSCQLPTGAGGGHISLSLSLSQ